MLILSPELSEADARKEVSLLVKEIEEAKGKITFDDFWRKRKLAFLIKRQDHGYYHVLNFEIDPDFILDFERDLRLNKAVLRHLVTLPPTNYKPITGAEVLTEEDAYFTEMRMKKSGGMKRKTFVKKKEEVPAAILHDDEEESSDTAEERAKKLDKILSDDLNI